MCVTKKYLRKILKGQIDLGVPSLSMDGKEIPRLKQGYGKSRVILYVFIVPLSGLGQVKCSNRACKQANFVTTYFFISGTIYHGHFSRQYMLNNQYMYSIRQKASYLFHVRVLAHFFVELFPPSSSFVLYSCPTCDLRIKEIGLIIIILLPSRDSFIRWTPPKNVIHRPQEFHLHVSL